MRTIRIGDRQIGPGQPTFVIAEIGANFNSTETAIDMVRSAARCGCDAVKIQTYRAETLSTPDAYFTFEDGSRVSQFEFWKAHEVSDEAHRVLKQETEKLGMVFFSTPSHPNDVELLENLGVLLHKIGSDDLTNYPFLDYVARKGKPMIVSTGMCELGEIEQAVRTILATGNDQLILLHCLVGYPAPRTHANLRVITTLQNAFKVPVGFSDHTVGNMSSILAVGMGAVAIEKHFTLDKSPGGPDNDTSAEPDEMAQLVRDIRDVSSVLGDGVKKLQPGEIKWREAGRKSLIAARPIEGGQKITREMLDVRRPSAGIHPKYLDVVVGLKARTNISQGTLIQWSHLSG